MAPLGEPNCPRMDSNKGPAGGTQASYRCPGTTPTTSPWAVIGPHLAYPVAPGGLDLLLSHLGHDWPRGQVQSLAYTSLVPRGRAPRPRLPFPQRFSLSPSDTCLLGAVYAALPGRSASLGAGTSICPTHCPWPRASSCVSSMEECESESVGRSVAQLWPRGLPTRLLCPWDSPGQNTAVRSLSLL